jgi:hypothetical protein
VEYAGEAMKNALAHGGAVLVTTVELVPEGLSYRYFTFTFLSVPALQQMLADHAFVEMARRAEENLRADITPTGPIN